MKRVLIGCVGVVSVLFFGGLIRGDLGVVFQSRLLELSPDDPEGYLELGELVLLDDFDQEGGMVGIELLVRAVYWGERNNQADVASSACITLAGIVRDERDRLWLWDMALLLDPSREMEWINALGGVGGYGGFGGGGRDSSIVEAAQCLYAIRYHQQPIGGELFARRDIREIILNAGEDAGVGRAELVRLLELEIQRGRDDSCRGRLYVAERGSPGNRLACPDHLRGLGMMSNDQDLRTFLRVEVSLAGIPVDSWRAAASISRDGSVNLPTVADLVGRMGVRAEDAFYRDGRWVATP